MNFITNTLKENMLLKLLLTDTGSLVYENEIEDVYEDFYRDKNLFDISDYAQDSKFLILSIKDYWQNKRN